MGGFGIVGFGGGDFGCEEWWWRVEEATRHGVMVVLRFFLLFNIGFGLNLRSILLAPSKLTSHLSL